MNAAGEPQADANRLLAALDVRVSIRTMDLSSLWEPFKSTSRRLRNQSPKELQSGRARHVAQNIQESRQYS